jgi:serine/threonine protein kinase
VASGSELATGYRVVAHLSRGHRLDVYDAWSDERGSRCVLKTLRPDRATESRARQALMREGRLLVRMTHPHIVRGYALTRALDDGRPVLVLETLGGETLSHLVHRLDERHRHLPIDDVAMLGLQLASAVGYLHRLGWLHLDLKPSNIVADGGRAKLLDLSIARRPGRVRPGTGTAEYLAPEQARGGQVGPAADVWGLGAVLCTALTGAPPYDDIEPSGLTADSEEGSTDESSTTDERAVGYPQLDGPPTSIRRRRRLPSVIADLVDGCLRVEPAQRPTLPTVSATLEAWLAQRSLASRTGRA